MIQALEEAVAAVAQLSAEEQDRFARWILDELQDEHRWEGSFSRSQGALGQLAAEARRDDAQGGTEDLDVAKL